MKIAITAQQQEMSAPLDPRFGRAPYFMIYDTDTKSALAVNNAQNLQAAQGAGIQAGQTLLDQGVGVLITGNVGPKAFRMLSAAGIQVYLTPSGTAEQVLQRFQAGELQESKQANVQGHWM
ncbi:MAG: dinitrogenase iron-molybdenum cofactor biosynthesis protein [Candidatus Omnitrophota bacterium]|jgi:predicted Fe-Mo cluster-binding NifX family protein|nr:MAG: dinitrogenase iron-molybdenum cofactor biosynthesis protein [Candidatus Omnitrophota bacterium]